MIQVQDDTGTLSPSELGDLRAMPSPYRTTVVLQDVGKGPMEYSMRACSSQSPSALCIGVNPHQKFVSVFYGIDVAGPDAATVIKKAGNSSFHNADWAQGVKDIVVRAEAVGHAARGSNVVIQQPTVTVDHGVPAAPFVIGFGVLGAIVVAVLVSVRRSRRKMELAVENVQTEAAELASANIRSNPDYNQTNEARAVHTAETVRSMPTVQSRSVQKRQAVMRGQPMPTYFPPMIATVPMASPVNDFATGMILGQAMSRPSTTYVEREVVVERPSYRGGFSRPSAPADPSPAYFSGSSSTDDSSSSGGSSDFGSSDSGGGSDSSGGGGSSDF